jgi:hypothetical protein
LFFSALLIRRPDPETFFSSPYPSLQMLVAFAPFLAVLCITVFGKPRIPAARNAATWLTVSWIPVQIGLLIFLLSPFGRPRDPRPAEWVLIGLAASLAILAFVSGQKTDSAVWLQRITRGGLALMVMGWLGISVSFPIVVAEKAEAIANGQPWCLSAPRQAHYLAGSIPIIRRWDFWLFQKIISHDDPDDFAKRYRLQLFINPTGAERTLYHWSLRAMNFLPEGDEPLAPCFMHRKIS